MCQTNNKHRSKQRRRSTASTVTSSASLSTAETEPTCESESDSVSCRRKPARRLPTDLRERPRKTVAFNEVVWCVPVMHIEEYTAEEKRDCWLTLADRQRTGRGIQFIVKRIRESKIEGAVPRGLEKFTDGGKITQLRKTAVREVLQEQQNQRIENKSGRVNPLKLRKAYRTHSRAARKTAYMMGKLDEMDAAEQTSPTIAAAEAYLASSSHSRDIESSHSRGDYYESAPPASLRSLEDLLPPKLVQTTAG